MNIFLDTNIWLRYFIGDHSKHLDLVRTILELNEESKLKISTSTFVLSEIVYTEQSFYNINRSDVTKDIKTIHAVKNLFLIEQTSLDKTLELFTRHKNAKWSDCIIASQVPKNYLLCSFDTKLAQLMGKERFISPEKVVDTFS